MVLRTKPSFTKRISRTGMFVSVALVLSFVENAVGFFNFAPGMKLGLANIVTMIALSLGGACFAIAVGLLRSLLASLFSGAVTMFLYSGLGTILCVVFMCLTEKMTTKISIIGRSMIGAFFFNLGQVIVASLAVSNIHMLSYLPVLTFVSTFCGIFTGYISKKIMEAEYVKL
ncbi:MAG: Gx transporter family protein [Clostridia bacterium]|nr:Gx transporter family protein [Clostridia bacterium]